MSVKILKIIANQSTPTVDFYPVSSTGTVTVQVFGIFGGLTAIDVLTTYKNDDGSFLFDTAALDGSDKKIVTLAEDFDVSCPPGVGLRFVPTGADGSTDIKIALSFPGYDSSVNTVSDP